MGVDVEAAVWICALARVCVRLSVCVCVHVCVCVYVSTMQKSKKGQLEKTIEDHISHTHNMQTHKTTPPPNLPPHLSLPPPHHPIGTRTETYPCHDGQAFHFRGPELKDKIIRGWTHAETKR